jgi:hypothetical protein
MNEVSMSSRTPVASTDLTALDRFSGLNLGCWTWNGQAWKLTDDGGSGSPINQRASQDFWGSSQAAKSGETPTLDVAVYRYSGGRREGVEAIAVRTPRVAIEIALTRGGGISKLIFDGISVGWKSPVAGPVHPNFVPLYRPDGLGWLAGFDEVLARCGLFNVGGPEFNDRLQLVHPLHGDIAYQPCHSASIGFAEDQRSIEVHTEVDVVLFHFHHLRLASCVQISLDRPEIRVVDTITNLGGRSAQVMLLHHWNFGPPIARMDSRIYTPAASVTPRTPHAQALLHEWDRLHPPTAGTEESVYFLDPKANPEGRGLALIGTPQADQGVALSWDRSAFPYLTLWKNPVPEADGYALGIEPGTCYPNGRTSETQAQRMIELAAGQAWVGDILVQGLIKEPESLAMTIETVRATQLSPPVLTGLPT